MHQERSHGDRIAGILRGYYAAQALYVVARLGVADQLAGGARGVGELARACGVNADALYRVLRALAGEGIFVESGDGAFGLTEVGSLLRSDVAGSMRPAALIAGEAQYKVWALLKESVKHGKPAFPRVFRQGVFDFFDEHEELYTLFNDAMRQRAARALDGILAACRVNAGDTIVDVGGGTGEILRALVEKHREVRGVLLEKERVISQAKEIHRSCGAFSRMTFEVGDFTAAGAIPQGDVMLLVTVLHMFEDATALRILRNCRASLGAGGRLYVVERLVRGPNEADVAKWEDLNMLVMMGGRERTLVEFSRLLEAAGYGGVREVREGILEAAISNGE